MNFDKAQMLEMCSLPESPKIIVSQLPSFESFPPFESPQRAVLGVFGKEISPMVFPYVL